MNFLAENRQRAADFQWARAGDLAHKVQDQIRYESGLGKAEINDFPVSREDQDKGEAMIQALKLEGFYASWVNEAHLQVDINWKVRLPRP